MLRLMQPHAVWENFHMDLGDFKAGESTGSIYKHTSVKCVYVHSGVYLFLFSLCEIVCVNWNRSTKTEADLTRFASKKNHRQNCSIGPGKSEEKKTVGIGFVGTYMSLGNVSGLEDRSFHVEFVVMPLCGRKKI